ncbi:conserved exported hypothetical protein [Verrucomicrobia bacterium]|nr:conserved exported hypothetical protein [Verrucomicrobiota bacterium]
MCAKNTVVRWLSLSVTLWLGPEILAQTSTNPVVVAFATTNSTPLNLGFAGFATEILDTGLGYDNTNFQALVKTLSPGWLRYPSGISDDAFNWSTGLTDTNWINVILSKQETSAANSCQFTYLPLLGKNGAQFTNFASLCRNVGGAKIIVVINAFTDTNTSAGAFAAFALSNHIPVAAWELCNEPYNFTATNGSDFFSNGTDYLNKMLPYRNAIKAADSNAVVAVFFSNPGKGGNIWDNALSGYSNRFWDAVSYHYYPNFPGSTNFFDLMAYDNGLLFSNTTSYVSNNLIPANNSNVTFMITEFQPVQGSGAGTSNQNPNLPSMTLYGGIYASEFILRMSTIPQMRFVGNFQLFNANGICATNVFRSAVTKAANGGYTTNTMNLPFGFYFSAQVTAEAVAYWAVNRSTAVYATTVGTNGPTVPMSTNYNTTMPAIYAQAYEGGNGKRYVVLTNKGSNAVPVQITQDGAQLTNQFLETFVTGDDPSATNSSPQSSPVYIQTATATNPVSIPEYSVVRLEWAVAGVPAPRLALTASRATQSLRWAGLTNVVYSVQGATSPVSAWSTLGRVANAATNFGFTNWNSGPQQFYRLAVP